VVRQVVRSRGAEGRRQPFPEVNAPTHLFNRDEVNRKSDEYPRRDPESEQLVRNHHRQAVNRKRKESSRQVKKKSVVRVFE